MPTHDLIVMGASAGGVEALGSIIKSLPKNFPAAVFIVLHIGANKSDLPAILSRMGPLPAVSPRDGERIKGGRIYVAPPDHHMLVKPGSVRILMAAKENFTRPAIDPLFRSAAAAYKARTVGVILSGCLDDGTGGLKAIKDAGGVTLVQDPGEAVVPDMCRRAIQAVDVDYVLPVSKIAAVLVDLAGRGKEKRDFEIKAKVKPDILELPMTEMKDKIVSAKATELTCPECGGVIFDTSEEGLPYFRCHVGHGYSLATIQEAKDNNVESALWNAVRVLEEKDAILRRIASRMDARAKEGRHEIGGAHLRADAQKAKQDAEVIRNLILNRGNRDGKTGKSRKSRKREIAG